MKKYHLFRISIITGVLLILGSLTNVIGYQQVQLINQKVINNEIDQKELLLQTIVNIANSKDIQRIILKSQINSGEFFSDKRFAVFDTPVLTKSQFRQMYIIGLMLSKIISKSQMYSMIERYQLNNLGVQKEITAIIEENDTLNNEMNQLVDKQCDCEKNNSARSIFTILCALLSPIHFILYLLSHVSIFFAFLNDMLDIIGMIFGCPWAPDVPE